MGVRRGGQEGALAPPPSPWPGKIVCFLTFLKENSMFLADVQVSLVGITFLKTINSKCHQICHFKPKLASKHQFSLVSHF